MRLKMKNLIAKLLVIFSFSFLMTGLLHAEFNPNGGENGEFWYQNTTRTIKWDTSYFHNNVNIYLWNKASATFTTIDTSIQASLGEYDWVIPENHPTGNYFRVKIQQTDSTGIYQFSETFFPIYEDPDPLSEVAEKPNGKENIIIYPNPTTGTTFIKYFVSKPSQVSIMICNPIGNYQRNLINEYKHTGEYQFEMNSSYLPSGVYFIIYKQESSRMTETRKMQLIK